MAVRSPRLAWYRSFYWRIGITFVAFVVVVLITQGVILSRTPRVAPFDVFRPPVLAAEVAADVADVLRREGRRAGGAGRGGGGGGGDRAWFFLPPPPPPSPRGDETKWGWSVFAAL